MTVFRTISTYAAVLSLAALVLPATQAMAAPAETPAQRDARMAWWKDARFGMFIHWGSVTLKGIEIVWSRSNEVPASEYDSLYQRFNPAQFGDRSWVGLAKAAGMKYIV